MEINQRLQKPSEGEGNLPATLRDQECKTIYPQSFLALFIKKEQKRPLGKKNAVTFE